MTTRNQPPQSQDDPDKSPERFPWYDALRKLLEPYEPVATAAEADELFSTPQIKQALEELYGMAQGDVKESGINGIELVETIEGLGFKFENTGRLEFHWLMKKK